MSTPLACQHHDHEHCIDTAMSTAESLCHTNGVRLTPLRRQVLALIWQSHKPLGAYTLIEQLAQENQKAVAPPTVYRALDFLLEQRLIHRLNRLNAFIGCPKPGELHQSHFLICEGCGIAIENHSPQLDSSLRQIAKESQFAISHYHVEVLGYCANCRAPEPSAP